MESKVHIIDDDESIRTALSDLLLLSGINTKSYSCAEDFLGDISIHDKGCALVDIRMPGMSGLELHEEMERRALFLPVIVMTGNANVDTAVKAMKEGVFDFIEKPFDIDELLKSVNTCMSRCDEYHSKGHYKQRLESLVAELTKRERQVMNLLVDGNQNKEIARELDISPRTVELHRAKVMEKLHAHTVSDVVRAGLVVSSQNQHQYMYCPE